MGEFLQSQSQCLMHSCPRGMVSSPHADPIHQVHQYLCQYWLHWKANCETVPEMGPEPVQPGLCHSLFAFFMGGLKGDALVSCEVEWGESECHCRDFRLEKLSRKYCLP